MSLFSFCHAVLGVRAWEREQVPMFTQQLGLDVLLLATARSQIASPACAKDFHLSLRASKDRVREVLSALEVDQFIYSSPDPKDARMKRIVPTAKGLALVNAYRRQFTQEFTTARPMPQLPL